MSIRTSVVLTEPQVKWLRKKAEKLGITVADLIRRIVDRQREEDGD